MGKINVKGLGVVNIEGDSPNTKEISEIKKSLELLNNEAVANSVADQQVDDYEKGPNFGRIALEVGGSVLGSLKGGGFTLPGLALKVGMLSKPFFRALAKASAGAGAGGAVGALASETFDPSENVAKEVARAAGEGALAEAVGGPLFIKGGQVMRKFLNKPRQFATELTDATLAENQLTSKAYEILYGPEKAATLKKLDLKGQIEATKKLLPDEDAIKAYMKKNNIPDGDFNKIRDAAVEMQKGLTPAFKTNNQTINILENIFSKSIFGGGQFAKRYRSSKVIGDRVAADVVSSLTEGSQVANKSELGTLFFNTFTQGEELFRKQSDILFKRVDDILGKNKNKALLSIYGKDGLEETVQLLNRNINLSGLGTNPNIGIVNNLVNKLRTVADTQAGKLSYAETAAIRADLAAHKEVMKITSPKSANAVNDVITKLDDLLSPEVLKKSGMNPDAATALDVAREFYKGGKDVFQRGTIVSLLAKGARETADMGSIFMNVTKGNKTDLLGRITNEIDKLPQITKGKEEIYNLPKAITQAQANGLKDSLRGHFLKNMLSESIEPNAQFGDFYNANKFVKNLEKNMDSLKVLYKDPADIKKLQDIQKVLGYAQGEISDIKGIPGGVLIQMKQAGAAGTVMQLGPGLIFPGAAGVAATSGALLPAVGILIAPKYLGKAMLDPKFQQLVFKTQYTEAAKGTLTDKKITSLYNQMIGRLFTIGAIDDDQKRFAEAQLNERNQAIDARNEQAALPLPEVQPSNFPIINQGGGVPTGGSNPQLAQALNLFNKGGIVSAKKNF